MPTNRPALSVIERVYITKEVTYGTAVAPVAADACLVRPGTRFTPHIPTANRPDKTGTRSQVAGARGRITADWEVPMSMAGNGVAGTPPDCDVLLQMAFGAAPTGSTYVLSDAIISGDIWSYRAAGFEQRVAIGAVCTELVADFGDGDFAGLTFRGEAAAIMDSGYIASVPTYSAAEKGGLASFPAEPASPVTNGNAVQSFVGVATFDGAAIAEILSGRITMTPGNTTKKNQFGTFVPTYPIGTLRRSNISFRADDTDSVALFNLKTKSKTKAPISIVMQNGTTAGNIWTWTLSNVLLEPPELTDPDPTYLADFAASPANATTLAALDDVGLVIT